MIVTNPGDRVIFVGPTMAEFEKHIGKHGVVVRDHPTHPTILFDDGTELSVMPHHLEPEGVAPEDVATVVAEPIPKAGKRGKRGSHVSVSLGPVIVSERYLSWLRDPEVTRYLESGGDYTLETLQAYVDARKKDSWFFGIYVSGEYVGNIKAGPLNLRHKRADIGVMIGMKSVWNKGVGTKAINLISGYCKGRGLHMLTCGILDGNVGSMKAFEKAGFVRCGEWKEGRWFEGKWVSEVFYQRIL